MSPVGNFHNWLQASGEVKIIKTLMKGLPLLMVESTPQTATTAIEKNIRRLSRRMFAYMAFFT